MEIRAKISLAVEQFKANAAVVGGLYKGMTVDAQKHTAAVDKLINKNLSNRINAANAGKTHDMSKLSEFEKAAVRSSRKMADEAMRAGMNGAYQKQDALRLESLRKLEAEADKASLKRRDNLRKEAEAAVKAFNAEKDAMSKYYAAQRAQEARAASRRVGFDNLKERVKGSFNNSANGVLDARKYEKDFQKLVFTSEDFNKSLVRTRYALYDVGSKLVAFGTGIMTALGGAIMKSAEFESAFTRVERTTGAAGAELNKLKKSLMEIATTSPISYEDITKVATLGAQMGIATDAIDDFTKTVSQFSAITGVSVEETAQAFGRLGQLLDVPASKFENLSSAITYVGVNAVATDREILNMSESIAAASNQAGFAADEVIGLSAALASLKVRPEEARGVIVRLFREIDSSVSEGGTRLSDFAKLMGYTSEQAASLWKQDPSQFFQSFLTGAKASGDLNGAITALGITNSRELNVIQRLANNTDVLASTMRDAREQYLLGTYAGDSYGKVQDDLQSKLKMLQSVIDQLAASFGDSLLGPMKVFVDMLIEAGKVLQLIPGPVKLVLSLLAALVGGFALFKGGMLLAIAGIFAMKTAMEGLGGTSLKSMATFAGLKGAMVGVGLAADKEALSLRILSGQLAATSKSTVLNNIANYGMVRSAQAATIATKGLAAGLGYLQKAFLPLMILGTFVTIAASIAEGFANTSDESKRLGDAMVEAGGGVEELRTAMMKDTAVYNKTGKSLGELKFKYDELVQTEGQATIGVLKIAASQDNLITSIEGADTATGKLIKSKENDAKATREQNELTERATQLTKEQTVALGANTAAFVARSLSKYGEEAKNFYEEFSKNQDKARWEAAGFDIAELIAAGLATDGGATAYTNKIKDDLIKLNSDIAIAFNDNKYGNQTEIANKVIDDWGKSSGKTAAEIKKMKDAQKAANYEVANFNENDQVSAAIDTYRESIKTAAAAAELQIQVLMQQGFSAEAAADQVSGLSEQLNKYLESSMATINATGKLYGAFVELSDGVKETDGSFDVFTEDGRSNMENFQNFMVASLEAAKAAGTGFAGGVEKIAAGLIVLRDGGYDTGDAFRVMTEYIANAAAGEQYSGLANNIREATDPSQLNGIIDAWLATQNATTEAGKAAIVYGTNLKAALTGGGYAKTFLMQWEMTRDVVKETTKEVKTILDYAKELGGVMKEAIDIKFSKTSGLIQLKNTVADINKGIKEARASIASLEASISEKKVTRAQLTTDLQAASQFGDVAEVSRIRAEIAVLDAEVASAQEDIAYNSGLATGSLDLNTQAGRDNVETIKSLVTSGADYIESLVQSGIKGDKLTTAINNTKTAISKQLKAMGLSKTAIKEYTDIFDGFVTIAKSVPDDVTVGANTDPAVQALNNFLAKVNASEATVDVKLNYPTQEERKAVLLAQKTTLQKEVATLKKANTPAAQLQITTLMNQIASIDSTIASGAYRNGGLIQGTGGNKQDNISIMASRGEFMMNAASVSRYGVDFMNALNQQRVPISGFGAGMSAGGNSSGGVVYLSARDRELLQAAVNRPITLRTSNRVIAQSANDGNRELANRGNN